MQNKKKYALAMIGCGDISLEYVKAAEQTEQVEIVKLMDINKENAEGLSKICGIPWTTSYEEILSDNDIYGVIISTPHYLHFPLVRKAAEAGKQILCDKPISTNIVDGQKMIDICKECGVSLSINYVMRFHPCIQKVKDIVQAGLIGKIRFMEIRSLFQKPETYWEKGYSKRVSTDWRASLEKSGGGILIMNVSHGLDCIRYITGRGISSVLGYTGRFGKYGIPIEVEDTAAAIMKLECGGIMTITASSVINSSLGATNSIAGENGTIEFDLNRLGIYLKTGAGGYEPGIWNEILFDDEKSTYSLYFEKWAYMQQEGLGVPVSGEDALYVLKTILDIYEYDTYCFNINTEEGQ